MGTGQSGKFKGKKIRLLKFPLSSFTYSFLPPNSHLSPSRALHHLLTLDTSPRSHTAIITRLPALTAYHRLSPLSSSIASSSSRHVSAVFFGRQGMWVSLTFDDKIQLQIDIFYRLFLLTSKEITVKPLTPIHFILSNRFPKTNAFAICNREVISDPCVIEKLDDVMTNATTTMA